MNKWIICDPIFESDNLNQNLKFAFWEGHRNFAYDFVKFIKPESIVELGSQYGCSLFAFLQTIKDNNINSKVSAVDFWSGDIGAGIDGQEVFNMVEKTHKTYFETIDLKMYQMSFNEAAGYFEDNSIDIVHIDGGHRFEDVENDFNTWLPKLKENGIILFHDVYSHIDDGSCIHWAETKKKYDKYFDFKHSCGLGVLFPKGNYWFDKLEEAGFFDIKDIYYYKALYQNTELRFKELEENYVKRFEVIQNQSKMINDRDECINAQTKLINERDEYIKILEGKINGRKNV